MLGRPLVGLDPQAYQSLRLTQQLDQQQLALRASRISQLQLLIRADSLASRVQGQELLATRGDVADLRQELLAQQARTRKALALPVQRPFLVDPHTYLGGALGVAAAVLFKVFVLPKLLN